MTSELISGAVIILCLFLYLTFLIKLFVFRREYPLPPAILAQEEAQSKETEGAREQLKLVCAYSPEIFEHWVEKEVQRRVKKQINSKKKRKKAVKKLGSKKKMGKPIGGRGAGRPIPSWIDRRETLEYERCPDCGHSFQGEKPHDTYYRYLLDLIFEERAKRLIAIQYEIRGHYCEVCKRTKYPKIDAPPKARLGWGLITWVIIKRVCRKMTFEAIAADLIDLCQEKISKTTLIQWLKKTAKPLEKIYAHLWQVAVKADYMHIDETGAPVKGKTWWLWVFLTKNVVLYHAHASRGHKAIQPKLTEFVGVIIADFWSAYNKLDQEQQKCLVHLIRELEEIIYDKLKQKAEIQQKLKENSTLNNQSASASPVQKKRGRRKKSPVPLTAEEVAQLKNQLAQLDRVLWNALLILFFFQHLIHLHNTATRTKSGQDDAGPVQLPTFEEAVNALETLLQTIEADPVKDADLARILKRLQKFKGDLFTFLKYEGLPHGNNPVEQKIRPFVIQRKISNTFGSEEGLEAETIHLSIWETCKLNQLDYRQLLHWTFHDKWDEIFAHLPAL